MKKMAVGLLFLFSVSSVAGQEGGDAGNGGGTITCEGVVESADLWEGRERHKYELFTGHYSWTEKEWKKSALNKLKQVAPRFADEVGRILSSFPMKVGQLEIADSGDARFIFLKPGCSYRQIAVWDDQSGHLFVDESEKAMLEKLPRDYAAFQVHEAIYAFARSKFGDEVKNSDLVRQLVAWMFSKNGSGPAPKFYDIRLDGSQRAKDPGFECPYGKTQAFKQTPIEINWQVISSSVDDVSLRVEVHREPRKRGDSALKTWRVSLNKYQSKPGISEFSTSMCLDRGQYVIFYRSNDCQQFISLAVDTNYTGFYLSGKDAWKSPLEKARVHGCGELGVARFEL